MLPVNPFPPLVLFVIGPVLKDVLQNDGDIMPRCRKPDDLLTPRYVLDIPHRYILHSECPALNLYSTLEACISPKLQVYSGKLHPAMI